MEYPNIDQWALRPERYVNILYHLLLGREPDTEGFLAHVNDLKSSGDPTRTLSGFLSSPECKRHLTMALGTTCWKDEIERENIAQDQNFNDILHEIRTEELRRTAGTSGTMVSIGCSNAVYFDWIHENLGTPGLHIGLEYYSPKPDVLPNNVKWIANTAGDMADVASNSVDLIFGGQVVEHLWADELINFLHECCRVLKLGGRLVFDTPNERITRQAGWKHAEHTIEFQPDDARRLLQTLGFRITKLVGHWLCENDDGFLRLNRIGDDGHCPTEKRIRLGYDRPEASFSWWIEARYDGDIVPDKTLTRDIVKDMWLRYSHYNFNRTTMTESEFLFQQPGRPDWFAKAPQGWTGNLLRSSSNAMPPGPMRVGVEIEPYQLTHSPGHLEIAHPSSGQIIALQELPPVFEGGVFTIETNIERTMFDGEFRLMTNGEGTIAARVAFLVSATVNAKEMWNLSPGS